MDGRRGVDEARGNVRLVVQRQLNGHRGPAPGRRRLGTRRGVAAAQSDKIGAMDAVDPEDGKREVVQPQNRKVLLGHSAALILLCAATVAAPLATRRTCFIGFVAVYALAAAAWLGMRGMIVSLRTAVVLAVALRAVFLVLEPQLSADVYRYLWDGTELASGHNPYARAPLDPRINHPEIPTIYPPHAELLLASAAMVSFGGIILAPYLGASTIGIGVPGFAIVGAFSVAIGRDVCK